MATGYRALTVPEFIERWQGSTLSEKSAAQSHFIDLCQMLGQPTPAAADSSGAYYTFEKSVTTTDGRPGFADVWVRGHFAWEYKGPHKDLTTAYKQLLGYREDLENPPLLVVSTFEDFQVHTNFTGTAKRVYAFTLADLASPHPIPGADLSALAVLRAVFTDPERLKPEQTTAQVTEAAAAEFSRLAERLRERNVPPPDAAHFLMQLLFCLFAEDTGLLPERLFGRLVDAGRQQPERFRELADQLFRTMADGGYFGVESIGHFNGGLFARGEALDLTKDDLAILQRASALDWASVEPAIFGTLFERSLDPAKRAQLGAHYTSKDDILLIVEPVLMEPLREEWTHVQERSLDLAAKRDAATSRYQRDRPAREFQNVLISFSERLGKVQILDPACGSGNFLYVALKQLLDLEREVVAFAVAHGSSAFFPHVGPQQLHGIELNEYAHELAQIVIWIGYIQWLNDNGYGIQTDPILQPLESIEQKDAILARDAEGNLVEPSWPEADVIIGNPPFLGGKRLRTELGDAYVNDLFKLYNGLVPREADLVCYWFERARERIADGRAHRAGLLATQSIRMGAGRQVLSKIKNTGDIFMAWSDRPWVLDGAAVRVSMVGFDAGGGEGHVLDGLPVASINADLTASVDLTRAARLPENEGISFMGDTKGGPFDIPPSVAATMLAAPLNPNGHPNSDVIRPWVNGLDITRRPRNMWIIDFGTDMSESDASLYEQPFLYVEIHVKPERSRSKTTIKEWWRHERPRVDMRRALQGLPRYAATPRVARHRTFVWLEGPTLADSRLYVFARNDDYFIGILHSRAHEAWSLATSSRHGVGNDPTYNNTTCFETFPFPWPLGSEPTDDPRVRAIADAAAELVRLRDNWLNPEGATEAELKTRTLTNLYNQRPTWLRIAHDRLDAAVFDAYGWPRDLPDDDILTRLLALNRERSRTPKP